MVVLSRIYTKTGDGGSTALGTGRRVPKDDRRIEAYGTVDELNSILGQALSAGLEDEVTELLRGVQNDLFDLGADLCVPEITARGKKGGSRRGALRMTAAHSRRLESAIDRYNASLETLRSFVLPGGTPAASWLHAARTVCRRAERRVVTLTRRSKVNPQVVVYLNRLSDLLFVLARLANDGGRGDILWEPGRSGR